MEFAFNAKIRDEFGKPAGILASSLSGAAFLTPADHYMVRKIAFKENFKNATSSLKINKGFLTGYLAVTIR